MTEDTISINRITKETNITLELIFQRGMSTIETPVGFINHMLDAASCHGGFSLKLKAEGDTYVDDHHLVEDLGIVLGQAFYERSSQQTICRFADKTIPMDDALCEVVIDVSHRPYLVYNVDFPVAQTGVFQMDNIREFFQSFSCHAKMNLHVLCHYGNNSHHIAEAIFKAWGKALGTAYSLSDTLLSTKGVL